MTLLLGPRRTPIPEDHLYVCTPTYALDACKKAAEDVRVAMVIQEATLDKLRSQLGSRDKVYTDREWECIVETIWLLCEQAESEHGVLKTNERMTAAMDAMWAVSWSSAELPGTKEKKRKIRT